MQAQPSIAAARLMVHDHHVMLNHREYFHHDQLYLHLQDRISIIISNILILFDSILHIVQSNYAMVIVDYNHIRVHSVDMLQLKIPLSLMINISLHYNELVNVLIYLVFLKNRDNIHINILQLLMYVNHMQHVVLVTNHYYQVY